MSIQDLAGSAPSREHSPPPSEEKTTPLPSPTRRNWVWFSCQFVLQLFFTIWLGYRVRGVEKIPEEGGGLLLINHQSYLDPLLVGLPLNRPVSYLARHNLFPVPIVGWMLRRTYVMPINQQSPSSASIKQAVRRMKHGFLVGVFPEGSRTETGELGELRPGFTSLIRRARLPVYPVGIVGAYEAMPRGSVLIRPTRVRVVFGDPISPEELAPYRKRDREAELVDLVRQRIQKCVDEAAAWREQSPAGQTSETGE